MELSLDFETYSDVDLKVVGTHRYAEHPSTEALMLGWAIDDHPVSLFDIHAGQSIPQPLEAALLAPEVDIWAFNAPFERLILRHCLGINVDPARVHCTMALAYSLGFMGKLDQVLDQFNMGVAKDPRGGRLIHRFCKPQPRRNKVRRWTHENDPAGYYEFCVYCIQDVLVERALRRRCQLVHNNLIEWDHYTLDQQINDYGLPVDRELVNAALAMAAEERGQLLDQMKTITALDNPNSNPQLSGWLGQCGVTMPDMQATTVAKELEEHDPGTVIHRVLELKQDVSKTSVSKWKTLAVTTADDDPWIRGVFQFVGAGRTGRWAGRKFQPHNLPRPTITAPESAVAALLAGGLPLLSLLWDSPMAALSSSIRSAIKAPRGYFLVVADLSSIESRLAGWVCNCSGLNTIFAEGRDVYRDLAQDIFGVAYDQVTTEQRTLAKPAALGAQYMLGGKGLVNYAEDMGIELEETEAQMHIWTYRDKYPEVCEFWYALEAAYMRVIQTGQPECIPRLSIWVSRRDEFLEVRLPTGRSIYYYRPIIEPRRMPWGDMRDVITYMGKNQYTQQWERIHVHPGKLLENMIQAIARDVLMTGLLRCQARGLLIIGHVHDEILLLSPDKTRATLGLLIDCMSDPMPWAPGLNLAATGYQAQRYRK